MGLWLTSVAEALFFLCSGGNSKILFSLVPKKRSGLSSRPTGGTSAIRNGLRSEVDGNAGKSDIRIMNYQVLFIFSNYRG